MKICNRCNPPIQFPSIDIRKEHVLLVHDQPGHAVIEKSTRIATRKQLNADNQNGTDDGNDITAVGGCGNRLAASNNNTADAHSGVNYTLPADLFRTPTQLAPLLYYVIMEWSEAHADSLCLSVLQRLLSVIIWEFF